MNLNLSSLVGDMKMIARMIIGTRKQVILILIIIVETIHVQSLTYIEQIAKVIVKDGPKQRKNKKKLFSTRLISAT